MLSRGDRNGPVNDRVALKDDRLVYRACSIAFARCLGLESPDDVIGKTDFDLLPNMVAREQMALDSRIIHTGQADISTIVLASPDAGCVGGRVADGGQRSMIIRTPVLTPDKRVRGVDIRLLGGPLVSEPAPSVSVDYRALVNDGREGCLIVAEGVILSANANAADVLGFTSAEELMSESSVDGLFDSGERSRIDDMIGCTESHAAEGALGSDRLTLTARTRTGENARLIARGTQVQWGASCATLLSFVDVALPAGAARTSEASVSRSRPAIRGIVRPAARTFEPTSFVSPAGVIPDTAVSASTAPAAHGMDAPTDNLRLLRVSEQRFRHYARSGADFFWELDANLMFRSVSEEIERVLGIPREYMIGRTHRQLSVHPANANEASHWEAHMVALEAHRPFRDFEFRWTVDGDTRVIRYSGLPVFDRDRKFLGYRGVGGDVTTAVRQAEATAYHANHDALTGLVNRRHFESRVGKALESSRNSRECHAMCFMDLDSFKIVNDTCGHKAGDELLRQLARLFDSLVRKSDVLARIGGDEFGVFLYKCDVAGALKLANQIRSEVEGFQFLWEEKRFTVGVSVGLVVVDDRWENIESLFNAADAACYIAKNEGRNRVVVYREGEGNASNRKIATHWVEEIDAALAGERLELACQRIATADGNGEGLSYEMLLRLRLASGEIASPAAFLPAAERYGLSSALDERAIDMTLNWLTEHPRLDEIHHVAINLASGSFTDDTFTAGLIERIEQSDVPASVLCFEISETATIANLAKATSFMQQLSAIGCRFTIDHFGSGLSSFGWLRDLPIEFLKIDGRLIKDIVDDPIDYTTVRAINDICRSMGKRTIAEFVESKALLEGVREIGIDFVQGYHVGRPKLIPPARTRESIAV